jgi:electron transfer flavoprotein alpha/beta subunit
MHIIVCLKQVPDSTQVKVNPETGTLIRAGVPSILNPYDHFALETALTLKEKTGAELTVISMGPPQAKTVIKLALALGADRGILLSDMAFAGSDTWSTSYALSKGIKKAGKADLILCGQMAIDGDTAQTGPGISQQLGIPQMTFCQEVAVEGKKVRAKKLIDDGHEVLEANLPALCTMTLPVDWEPKYPSFVNIVNAQEKPFEIWTAQDIGAEAEFLGLNGSPTQVDKVYPPPQRERGTIHSGSESELVAKLLEIFKQENVIKQ